MDNKKASNTSQISDSDIYKKATARRDAAEEMFKLLVESVKDYGIFMLDLNGIIQGWNQGAERIKGYKANEVIGKHFSLFYTEEDRARNHPQNELEIALKEGRYEEEGWRVKKDGSRFWANIVITRLENQGRVIGFGKVTRDLTERKKAEDELKQANESLEHRIQERTLELQQAVRARDEFLSIASHELRTPITPLKLQIQGLIKHIRNESLMKLPPERLEKMATSIDLSLNRLGKLVDSLLDVARINAGKIELHPENIDLNEVVASVCERIAPEAVIKGSEIKTDLQTPINGLYDRLRLEQVIINLCMNAVKYGKGKPILVSTQIINNEFVLKVKDNGIGISEIDLPKIFNRFERVGKNLTGADGLGLGLYITEQIVSSHHGKIEVQSKYGEGTTFIVKLPLKK